MMNGVYFVRAENGLIKIGYSRNVSARLQVLQTGSPIRLELLAVTAGGPRLEEQLHERFAADRWIGEWFRISPALTAIIQQAQSAPYERPIPKLPPGRRKLMRSPTSQKVMPLTKRFLAILEASPTRTWSAHQLRKALGDPSVRPEWAGTTIHSLWKRGKLIRISQGQYRVRNVNDASVEIVRNEVPSHLRKYAFGAKKQGGSDISNDYEQS